MPSYSLPLILVIYPIQACRNALKRRQTDNVSNKTIEMTASVTCTESDTNNPIHNDTVDTDIIPRASDAGAIVIDVDDAADDAVDAIPRASLTSSTKSPFQQPDLEL